MERMNTMEKRWCVYILQCADGTFYTGITNDIVHRLRMHSNGTGAKYTRGRGPVKLCYREVVNSQGEALKREYAIKQLRKTEKMKLIETYTPEDF